jgi:hypothetical protein
VLDTLKIHEGKVVKCVSGNRCGSSYFYSFGLIFRRDEDDKDEKAEENACLKNIFVCNES